MGLYGKENHFHTLTPYTLNKPLTTWNTCYMNTSKKDEQQMLWYSEVENANANTSSKIKQTIWTK